MPRPLRHWRPPRRRAHPWRWRQVLQQLAGAGAGPAGKGGGAWAGGAGHGPPTAQWLRPHRKHGYGGGSSRVIGAARAVRCVQALATHGTEPPPVRARDGTGD